MSKKQERYVKMDPVEHVLKRPDMYVGSTKPRDVNEYVYTNGKIVKKRISISPALAKIFNEILSNAIDNLARSKENDVKMTQISVDIDQKTGEISVMNDGDVIPIEIHEKEQCHVHTMIFGQLLTGSNYDDSHEREDIGGLNGLGCKVTNCFSKYFRVEGVDPNNKLSFEQTWRNNMRTVSEPIVKPTKERKGYTKVTFIPDFEKFHVKGYSNDVLDYYRKCVVDAAMITKLSVLLDDEPVPIKNVREYARLYAEDGADLLQIRANGCDVILMPTEEYEAISFANGICTPLGGTHVDAWSEGLFRPLVEKLNKGKKSTQITIKDVKHYFRLFVNATVKKPGFDSQSKLKLESPTITAEVTKAHLSAICKWPVMEQLNEMIRAKEMLVLKKVERKKRGYNKVENHERANFEGTASHASECTLFIVEGKSAATFANGGSVQGLFGKAGNDWNGTYELRGKVLNTRNEKCDKIAQNKVVSDIIKCLGITFGLDYTKDANFVTLRYGRVVILCDQDCDGLHICSLLQNLFHTICPTLLTKKFLYSMQTMIVRVNKNLIFYDEDEYKRYRAEFLKKNPGKKLTQKYYKGLGSNEDADIEETFGKKMIEFYIDDHTTEVMKKAFSKENADVRKEWLTHYDPNFSLFNWSGNKTETRRISHSEYINKELIKYSIENCRRSIPHLMDGLKEGHRKVLFTMFKRKMTHTSKTIKVSQLAGSVSETSSYHHGEDNLLKTITGMARSFVGSNNIPLLYRDGQFGTRRYGGDDAANGRYIWTKLDVLTRLIFRKEDDCLLEYREDDGDRIEPYFYVPIIPMILVNGIITAIGTGWSSNVPCYNPLDVVENIRIWLDHDGKVLLKNEDCTVSLFNDMIPWYRGHNGTMERTSDSTKFISRGDIKSDKKKFVIDELPVGVWTDDYRQMLEKMIEEKKIKDFNNGSSPKHVKFTITPIEGGVEMTLDGMKLSSVIRTSNMCTFTTNEQLKRYGSVEELLDEFCRVRYDFYTKRKQRQQAEIENNAKLMGNKKRFLMEVRDETIHFFEERKGKKYSRKTSDLYAELEKRGYDKIVDKIDDKNKGDDTETKEDHEQVDSVGNNAETDRAYDYLLRLQFRSITEERINELQNDIDSSIKELEKIKKTNEKELWKNDLDEFAVAYKKWLLVIATEKVKTQKDSVVLKKRK